MKKAFLGVIFASAVVLAAMPIPTYAAGLNESQILAILSLLSAFGVDTATITNVSNILHGSNGANISTTQSSHTPPVNVPPVSTPPISTLPVVIPPPPPTTAAACSGVVSDNFNSYSSGPVVGQGGWLNRANGTPWVVESTTTQEGAGALFNANTGSDSVITKTGAAVSTNGTQCYWVYPQNPQSWGSYNIGENVQMGVFQGSWDGPIRTAMAFMKDGHVAYIDPRVNKYVEFDSYNANTWNEAQIQWRSSDNTARFRLNSDAWSDWIPLVHQWNGGTSSFTGFDTVGFVTVSLRTGGVYIDNLR